MALLSLFIRSGNSVTLSGTLFDPIQHLFGDSSISKRVLAGIMKLAALLILLAHLS